MSDDKSFQSPMIRPPIQFHIEGVSQEGMPKDFVAGQQVPESADGQLVLAFWKKQLNNAPVALELPTDYARSAARGFRRATQPIDLPRALSAALKALSREAGVTLFTTLLAAFKALLYRYTGQNDIIVGSTRTYHQQDELKNWTSCCGDLLALRTELGHNPTFCELLRRVQDVTDEAYAHATLPLEKLIELLKSNRDLTRTPAFQILFILHSGPRPPHHIPALDGMAPQEGTLWDTSRKTTLEEEALNLREADSQAMPYELALWWHDTPQGLSGTINYNANLFEASTIERLAHHLLTLLEGIVVKPERQLADLPLLTAAEQQQLLVDWNDTRTDDISDRCIHHLFEERVAQTPDAIALIFEPPGLRDESGSQYLTYRELDRRANQLAQHLKRMGVRPEVLIGVCMERTIDLVIGLLAVLKAGGAYVPLDPSYPPDRIAFMLADAAAPVVLTQQHLLSRLPNSCAQAFCIDTDWAIITQAEETSVHCSITPANLAYIIYTSGSTGRPKGVAITHGNAMALLNWAVSIFPLQDLRGVLAATSICFDLSVYELFLPLSQGGTIVLAENALHLPALLNRDAVTLVNTVPSVMTELARSNGLPTSVHTVNLAGEPLKGKLVQQIYEQVQVQAVYNLYGPSEDTTYSTFIKIDRDDPKEPSIGRPIGNTQAYILDAQMQLVPVGVIGQLYLGGAGVSRGYLNRPELTAERYVPNPFARIDGALAACTGDRLYRTGDLARYRPDGNIEFLGRIDHQVKIRGFRIELGEIEAALGQHSAVREALVVTRENQSGDQRLIAYVVSQSGQLLAPGNLRRSLKEKLPEYMIPSAFVILDSLPLTPNRKIDRQALPMPDWARSQRDEEFVAPRNPIEKTLAAIWSQVLNVEQVGVHDNFFELGGHSLLITRMASRLQRELHVETSWQTLFEHPTIAELAQCLVATQGPVSSLPVAPPRLIPRDKPIPLSFSQEQFWFMQQLAPDSPLYNVPTVFHITGTLDATVLESCLNELVRRHEALRTVFEQTHDQPVQVILPFQPIRLEMIDLRPWPEAERLALAQSFLRQRARQLFDLRHGPLLRATLFQLADHDYQFLLNIHHIATDGWSTGVIMAELKSLYAPMVKGEAPSLPDLPIQYADFTGWQRQVLQGDQLERHVAYWRGLFADRIPILALPTDRPRPAAQSYQGGKLAFPISTALLDALAGLGQQDNASLFMVMLAAFQMLLYHYTGQTDLVVATAAADRSQPELEDLIGAFVNTLPMRADLSDDPAFEELVRRVQQSALEAYAHQDLPIEKIVEVLNLERTLSYNPLFQVMFDIQNSNAQPIQLPNLRVGFVEEVDTGTAKSDLIFSLEFPEQGPVIFVEYNTDIFEAATVQRMLAHFQMLLEGVVANPRQRLSEQLLLTKQERQQLVVEWNATQAQYPQDVCIHELFEAQVSRTADAVALVLADQALTYGELNRRANQVANHLQRLGVGPETLVGVYLERSVEIVVGLLGILKAGGAYVPLDPAYPAERLAFILQDTQLPILLSQASLLDRLPAHQARIVCLESDGPVFTQASDHNPDCSVLAQNLAYVIYTSGSTGRPKGVAIQHYNTVAFVHWAQRVFEPTALQGVLAATSICFDLSVFEIFVTLSAGGTIVLAQNALHLPTLTAASRVTLINTVPSAVKELVQSTSWPASVRVVNLAGEPLAQTLVDELYRREMIDRVYDLYGPSETTTYSTYALRTMGGPQTIGRPIGNTQIYILDAHLNPVPVGVTGEVYVGGEGVTRGYLNQPDVTAEKFIPNPFTSPSITGQGARLYKTGDLARYFPDGNIEFLGRRDFQVKVRGFRIELGEIEAVLNQHPGVQTNVVDAHVWDAAHARDDTRSMSGDKRLVAYVVPNSAMSLTVDELRRYLRERLPDYMLPTAFVLLEALPLNPNGKVDRRALPVPDTARPSLDQIYVAPRTSTEDLLTDIWRDVLVLKRIGIYDNFFELGGHSLLATQVISRMQAIFQVDVSLRTLFEAPTIADLSARIEADRRKVQRGSILPLSPFFRPDGLPLSFAQQRLWFLDQLEPNSAFYNIPLALHLTGQLDLAAFEQSFNEIVRRHASLRTTLAAIDGQAIQIIAPTLALALPLVDLQALSLTEREACVKQLATEEAQRPFTLGRGPLVRASILRLGSDEHVLLLNMHHIISDGWSMNIFIRELAALYLTFSQGQPSPLPELPIQYADFAVWQREWLQGEVLAEQLSYWQQQLSGVLPTLELPTDHPRPAVQTFHGACRTFQISRPLSRALQALSRQAGVTLFMTLLAAFQALLQRYTGQLDVAVGTPIAGRNRVEIEDLIGFFVNTLVLRLDLSGNPTIHQLLQRVRDVTLGAYAHQDMPFEMLVEVLKPERDLSRSPLFQVMFAFQNTPQQVMELPDLKLRFIEVDSDAAKFDLTLDMVETDQGLLGEFEYSTDLFEAATIDRWIEHFQVLLTGFAADPQQRLADLPLLTEAERQQLLIEWNDTPLAYPRERCLHSLVEAQVAQTPDAIALVFEDQALTYGELNRRANQLAHSLQALNMGPEAYVGVCVDRSLEMLIALLGILKAGGAYVPMDPASPTERLASILEDAQPAVVLTQKHLVTHLPRQLTHVMCLDADWTSVATSSEVNPVHTIKADNLAYVIYTSGSTGQPKGVMISHRALVQYATWAVDRFEVTAHDRVLQFASISFDTAAEEIYPCLLCGATLILRTDAMLDSIATFTRTCAAENITFLDLPTAYWHSLASELALISWPPSIRLVIIGGEQANPEWLPAWQVHVPSHVRLINTYGQTETTIIATACDLAGAGRPNRSDAAIGRPAANTQIYLLDSHWQPVPIGVTGELYIGGDGLARGYLNRPELTAEKFIPNPFEGGLGTDTSVEGTRLYKTGDLARYLPDGNLEFSCRADHQVKIRGYRIELGDIEAILKQHPKVLEAVVVVRAAEHDSDKQLVAYLVARAGDLPEPHELRDWLKAKLPTYMLPAAFVKLDRLPLTQSAKIDRRALPAPDWNALNARKVCIPPRTPIEQALASVWTQVLGVKQISIHDNFFELGGHSLLAAKIVARLGHFFGHEVTVRLIFQSPTIAALTARIEAAIRSGAEEPLPPIQRISTEGPVPLSFSQQQLWLIDQLNPGTVAYNYPFPLRIAGALDVAALQAGLTEIMRRHQVLRTTFVAIDGHPFQVINPAGIWQLPLIDLSYLSETEREAEAQRLMLADTGRPFDLVNGPLVRAALFQLAPAEHILLLTLHHVVFDGWSLGILFDELATLYQSYSAHQPVSLPELAIQYADYAAWQRQWLDGVQLEQRLAYWKQQLHGSPAIISFPLDRVRPPRYSFRGAQQSLSLSKALSDQLQTLSHQTGVTLFMTLLAALKILIYRYTAQTDIVIGTVVANRQRPEIEGLIGYFLNVLALRTRLQDDWTFHELLRQVRETALGAYEHQELPFEKLVEALRPKRNLDYNPFFQIMLILQNTSAASLALPGLSVTALEVDPGTLQFVDMNLMLEETDHGVSGLCVYNTDLFDRPTIQQILADYTTLLESIAANPNQAIATLLPALRVRPRSIREVFEAELIVGEMQVDLAAQRGKRLNQRAKRNLFAPDRMALMQTLLQKESGESSDQSNSPR